MALTETTNRTLGFIAPDFTLLDVTSERNISLSNVRGQKATVVMFICNHCPYVVHVKDELVRIANEYQERGISFVAISSNDIENYPEDAPDKMKDFASDNNFPFPYLYDASQKVAKAYDAACTPDFSVFDADLKCVYRGRLDDSTPGNNKAVTGSDLRGCLDAICDDNALPKEQFPSMGCNIKWK